MDNKAKDGVIGSPASKASLIPSIAIAIGLLLLACSNKKKIERDFYLPADFEGTVFVVFGIPGFPMAEKDQEGNYVFRIPDSGILLVGNEFENGLTRYRYFTYCNGRAYKLKRMNPNGYCEDMDCEKCFHFQTISSRTRGWPGEPGYCSYEYFRFFIGSEYDACFREDLNKAETRLHAYMDSIYCGEWELRDQGEVAP